VSLLGGSEAIVGIVVLVLVWLATRVLQKRNVGRQATALGKILTTYILRQVGPPTYIGLLVNSKW
jgi:hypothetical protein